MLNKVLLKLIGKVRTDPKKKTRGVHFVVSEMRKKQKVRLAEMVPKMIAGR